MRVADHGARPAIQPWSIQMQQAESRDHRLLAAAAMSASNAHAAPCGPHRDFAGGTDPVVEAVRPVDCATLLGTPPEFTWARQDGADMYTVALTFPDGHTETRSTRSNWLAWDRPVPAGDYTWRVSVSGRTAARSDARVFRVDGAVAAQPRVAAARGNESASATAAASPVFQLQSTESWVPFARSAAVPRRSTTGGVFGGFTE